MQSTRKDESSEHMSEKKWKVFGGNGIQVETCCVEDYYQNGMVEKVIRDVTDMVRCMSNHAEVSHDMLG